MSEKTEDILLQINHVRFKKNDGQLCMAHKKIGWILNNTDSFAISIPYTDIKTQKISPEGKAKVQLQLILIDQTTSIFHFANPEGKVQQVLERNQVKERLSQLLTASRRQPPDELLEKKRILEENPHLHRLYQDLVPRNLLQPDLFWKDIAATYKKSLPPTMEMGVSGAFLADIKPQTDGTNGKVLYNLTPDIMLAIFKTYPAVKKKHDDYVPSRMTESDFWTRFFQSHYYSAHTTTRTEDVFSECAKYDDKEWIRDLAKVVTDPILALNNMYEEPSFVVPQQTNSKAGSNFMHATMIKRFNQHSQNILKAQSRSEHERLYDELILRNPDHLASGTPAPQPPEPKSKKARLLEKLVYSDLDADCSLVKSSLNLHQKDRYLAGPPTHSSAEPTPQYQLEALEQQLCSSLASWRPDLSSVQQPVLAHKTLQLVSETCKRGRSAGDTNGMVEELPLQLRSELCALYGSGGELLRHFWSCFPPRTPQLVSKLQTLHTTLGNYHQATLRPFQEKAIRDYNCRSGLLDHLIHMFHTANTKYENWKSRYGGR